MGREVLGTVACPECGFSEAQVKTAKSGFHYRYCPDCNAQFFARTPEASARLAAKAGAGTGTGRPAAPPEVPAAPVRGTEKPAPAPRPVQAKSGFALGGL